MYTIAEAMQYVYAEQTAVVIAALLTYFFGFGQYLTSMYMQIKHKECPFYFWMHCWYFGHDITFSFLFNQWWHEIGFWLFKVLNIGCMMFVCIEFVSFYYAVKYEKNWNWGKYFPSGKVGQKKAILMGIGGYAIGTILFVTARKLIGDPMCLVLMMSTNTTLAICVRFNMQERKYTRKGSKALAWWTLIGTIFTFMPPQIGFFTRVIRVLDNPYYYLLGALCLVSAIFHVYYSYKLPTFEQFKEQYPELAEEVENCELSEEEIAAKANA